ncbi:MAG: IPT/TIG domain-containing protein [Armatimonadota bacterium]
MKRIVTTVSSIWHMIVALLIVVLPAYAAGPSITSFSPTSGAAGLEVIITGANFAGATSVTFSGAPAGFSVRSATSISAFVPEKAITGKIKVTTTSGSVTSDVSFTVVPTITGYTPTSGIPGDVITVSGTAFTGASAVKFNGVTATFTVSDSQTLTTTVPVGAVTGKISVTTPSGTATSATSFKIRPVISSFAPASGKVGASVTITGTSFTGATAVKFKGIIASYTVNSSTSVTATVPLGATTGKITVTTGGGTATSETDFPVLPTITSFTPSSGQIGSEVTITGSNFTGATRVDFRSYNASMSVVNDTTIVAYVPVQATTGKVGINTPAGRTLSDIEFTVVEGTKITSFTPTSGIAGQSVVITGLQFNVVTGVNFNSFPAQSYTIDSDTQITAVVPANATTGKIYLDIPHASKLSPATFTVLPTITSFTPASGKPGDTVVIQGTAFVNVLGVKFNDIAAASWSRNSNTSVNAVIPVGAGTGKIQITTLDGVATSDTDFVGYDPAQLELSIDLGAEYIGAPNHVQLNYVLSGPQEYNGVLPMDGGGMALLTDLQPGTYQLTLSGSHWLKRVISSLNIDGFLHENIALANGDSDGDSQVNLFDFVVLDQNFGKIHAMADLDGSGAVNLFDYVIIDQNFGAQGDIVP